MNAPVWLLVLLTCGWGALTIRFVQKANLPFALLSAAMFAWQGWRLWMRTRGGK
ncbi:hypothetical protein [Deinococcus hopiensis]|uniref:Uncharacterized protein n=1 Tax=Deinococcus hopiensis KR-140 TaxID=695939 RepID=A0A1W1VP34_9DEIO|nr:hypothetical protein [Deinococcus hopiensis]SMB95033.1 hypothetical protein SAMN00790413_02661 [Deinococcus hopiensis KR-140]